MSTFNFRASYAPACLDASAKDSVFLDVDHYQKNAPKSAVLDDLQNYNDLPIIIIK